MRIATNARRARVVSVGRNAAWIVFDDESEPRLASLRRSGGKRVMVVPGDLIEARALDEERVVIDRMLARTSELERYKASGTTIMAANVDAIAIVSALVDPPLRFEMIDRLIAFAELRDLRSIVVLTKIDLAPPLAGDSVCALYGGLGYTAIPLNPKSGVGIPDLRAQIGATACCSSASRAWARARSSARSAASAWSATCRASAAGAKRRRRRGSFAWEAGS